MSSKIKINKSLVSWSKNWRSKKKAHFIDVIFDLLAYVLGMERKCTTYNKKIVYIRIVINDKKENISQCIFNISNNPTDTTHVLKINLNTLVAYWEPAQHDDMTFTSKEYFKIIKNLCRGLRCIKIIVKDDEMINLCENTPTSQVYGVRKYMVPFSALNICLTDKTYYSQFGFVFDEKTNYNYLKQLETRYDTRQIDSNIVAKFKIASGVYTLKKILRICLQHRNCDDYSPKIKRWITTQLRYLDIPSRYVLKLRQQQRAGHQKNVIRKLSSLSKHKHIDEDVGSAISSKSHYDLSLSKNSSRIDDNKETVQEILYEYKKARRRIGGHEINPWLKPIIPKYNPSEKLKTIEGLVSLKHITIPGLLYGNKIKHIILCGDVHTDKEVEYGGQFMLDWLVNTLVIKQDKCIDLFIEDDTILSGHHQYTMRHGGPMAGATFFYIPIIKKFKNLRIHDVDMRTHGRTNTDRPMIPVIIEMFKQVNNGTFVQGLSMPEMYTVMTQLLLAVFFHIKFKANIDKLFAVSTFSKFIVDKFDEYRDKHVGGLVAMFINETNGIFKNNDKIVAKIEKQFVKSYFKRNRDRFCEKLFVTVCEFITKIKEPYDGFIISLFMPLMDVYCLARMFRTFNGDIKEFTEPCSDELETCVVYVGNAHSEIYATFIEKYFINSKLVINEISEYDEKILNLDEPIVIM